LYKPGVRMKDRAGRRGLHVELPEYAHEELDRRVRSDGSAKWEVVLDTFRRAWGLDPGDDLASLRRMRDDLDAELAEIDDKIEELREQREEAQDQHERVSGRIEAILEEQRELREVIDEIRTQLEADEAPTIFALESTLISEASMIEYGSKSPGDREAMIEHIEELAREEDWEVPQDKFEVGI